ncbi:MAG: glycoside hydrolase family 10 protein, partial [Limisphaerales bacterium]
MKKPSFLRRSAALASLVAAAELFSSVVRADEMRALWVDAFGNGFLSSNQVAQLVADCRTYNFNAVIVQMRRRGDAFYMPQAPNLEPRTTAIASNFDALQEIINQCNNGSPRIEVHVWAPANLIWGDTTKPPTQANHVYNLHPEYLTKTSGGSTQFAEGYFLDPGNPDAMAWNYRMAKDVVSRYDIDGFHWDYIRYPQQDSGYNSVAIARYNAEYGLTGQPSASNSQFSNWRRRQVTDFLRWVNSDLLEIKPSLMISASVFGSRTDALNARFQDWPAWNTEGILDLTFPMIYSADNTIFTTRVNDAFNNQGARRIYVGLGAYLNTKENTLTQLDYVRGKGFLGSSIFSYRTPNSGTVNQADTFEYIRSNYQPTWAEAPALPWIANPTKGLVKGTVSRVDNGDAIYNATVTLTSSTNRTQRSQAHGKYAFFEVAPGTYTISAASGGASSSAATVNVLA